VAGPHVVNIHIHRHGIPVPQVGATPGVMPHPAMAGPPMGAVPQGVPIPGAPAGMMPGQPGAPGLPPGMFPGRQ
jgi:hypothetical protein